MFVEYLRKSSAGLGGATMAAVAVAVAVAAVPVGAGTAGGTDGTDGGAGNGGADTELLLFKLELEVAERNLERKLLEQLFPFVIKLMLLVRKPLLFKITEFVLATGLGAITGVMRSISVHRLPMLDSTGIVWLLLLLFDELLSTTMADDVVDDAVDAVDADEHCGNVFAFDFKRFSLAICFLVSALLLLCLDAVCVVVVAVVAVIGRSTTSKLILRPVSDLSESTNASSGVNLTQHSFISASIAL